MLVIRDAQVQVLRTEWIAQVMHQFVSRHVAIAATGRPSRVPPLSLVRRLVARARHAGLTGNESIAAFVLLTLATGRRLEGSLRQASDGASPDDAMLRLMWSARQSACGPGQARRDLDESQPPSGGPPC